MPSTVQTMEEVGDKLQLHRLGGSSLFITGGRNANCTCKLHMCERLNFKVLVAELEQGMGLDRSTGAGTGDTSICPLPGPKLYKCTNSL